MHSAVLLQVEGHVRAVACEGSYMCMYMDMDMVYHGSECTLSAKHRPAPRRLLYGNTHSTLTKEQ